MKNYTITIPKPCHEDWNKMSPNKKGRFCNSCTKTVVDFTKKSTKEIQTFFQENKDKPVCGHFKKTQLDSIVLQIPETVFYQQLSFQKLFILALLFAMGTTLFSCKKEQKKPQKTEKVELIGTAVNPEKTIDSLQNKITEYNSLGFVFSSSKQPNQKDSILKAPVCNTTEITGDIRVTEIVGEIITEEGKVYIKENQPIAINIVEFPPKFKGTKATKKEKLLKIFNKKMNEYVNKNFDKNIYKGLGLSTGKKKIYAQFVIDSLGNVSDIKVKAPHLILKNHTNNLFQKLPQFIPATQKGKNVGTRYTLPIIFEVK